MSCPQPQALKSLPFAAEERGAARLEAQLALAGQLAAELEAEATAWPTSLEEDAALAAARRGAAGGGGDVDGRLAAAVDYRLQRKALVMSCRALLRDFSAQ